MNRRLKWTLWLLIVLAPLLSGLLLAALTSTSLTALDDWETHWTDEIGYWRATETINETGLPVAANGFNEQESAEPAYGHYNYVTYWPYYLASFVTGGSLHNRNVYANVLFVTLTCLFGVLLLKPDVTQSLLLLLLQLTHLLLARYTWSGMSECTTMCAALTAMLCAVWLFRHTGPERSKWKTVTVLLVQTAAILFGGLIRPFNLTFLVFPLLWLAMAKGPRRPRLMTALGLVLLAGGTLVLYLKLGDQCAPYFYGDQLKLKLADYAALLKIGSLRTILLDVWNMTSDAFARIFTSLRDSLGGQGFNNWNHMMAFIATETLVLMLLALIRLVRCAVRGDKKHAWIAAAYLLTAAVIMEANILFYEVDQLHRMLLCVVSTGAVLFILDSALPEAVAHQLVLAALMGIVVARNTGLLYFPQTQTHEKTDAALRQELTALMPVDETDIYGNTVAVSVAQTDNYYIRFCFPGTAGFNYCQDSYLLPALRSGTLKSRYLLADESETALIDLCRACGWAELWRGEETILFRSPD